MEAEMHLGGRVDHRKAYFFTDNAEALEMFGGGPVYEYGEWTTSCSGCLETEDGHPVGSYPWDEKAKCRVGSGCEECGYTGKRRDGWFSPATLLQNAEHSNSHPEKI